MEGHGGGGRTRRREAENEDEDVGLRRKKRVVMMNEEGKSEIRRAIDEVSTIVKSKPKNRVADGDADGDGDGDCGDGVAACVPFKPLLSLCKLILLVLDKIGPTMAVLRMDILHNIQRLESLRDGDPIWYSSILEVIEKEKRDGNARKGNSCCRAFVWLVRSLDFSAALLQRLAKDPHMRLQQAVEESYNTTLRPWHGWISSAAFKVALKLVPGRARFVDLLKTKDTRYDDFTEEVQALVSLLAPLLEDIHRTLKSYGLDRLKSP